MVEFCSCGCGNPLIQTNKYYIKKFINGHSPSRFKEGHITTEITRKKISIKLKGQKPSPNAFTKEALLKRTNSRKDYKSSIETNIKIGIKMLKNKNRLDKPCSEEAKIQISEKRKKLFKEGKIVISGCAKLSKEDPTWHPCFNNYSSFEPYGIEFNNQLKEQVKEKYNYRCQQCFRHQAELYSKRGRKYKLIIHHIDYDKQNNSEENLIPLCNSCHMQTNFNRKGWTNYFQDKVILSGGNINDK